METATAVEIDKGRLRQLLLDDFHQLFGKAFANTAPAFPPLLWSPDHNNGYVLWDVMCSGAVGTAHDCALVRGSRT